VIYDLYERQCGGGPGRHPKIKHKNYAAARKHRKSLQLEDGGSYDIYRCPWCGFLHVGHKDSVATRAAKANVTQRPVEPVVNHAHLQEAS